MEVFSNVLDDCLFSYEEITTHGKNSNQKSTRGDKQCIKVKIPYGSFEVRSTFADEILSCTLLIEKGQIYQVEEIKDLATNIGTMRCTIDSPHVFVEGDVPSKVQWMLQIKDRYIISVLLNIISNFPFNITNDDIL